MSLPAWLEPLRASLLGRLSGEGLPHALLLLGGPGLGKRSLARWLARRALCNEPAAAGDGCGRCRSCTLFKAGTHPDFVWCRPKEGKQQIAVDQIRELIGKAGLTRSASAHQVFVIEPAERLNLNGANALLKTLEEPTPGTLLLLLAERRDALPATVLSRCQVLAIRRPAKELALGWLRASHPALDETELRRALRAGGGSPGLAGELIAAGAQDQMAGVERSLVAVAEGRQDVAAAAATWVDERLDHRLRWMAELLVAVIWDRLGARRESPGSSAALERLTAEADVKALLECYRRTNLGRRLLAGNLRPELLIEDLLLTWQRAVAL